MTSLNDNFGSTTWIIVQGPLKIKQKINDRFNERWQSNQVYMKNLKKCHKNICDM